MDGWMDLLVGTGVNTAVENVQYYQSYSIGKNGSFPQLLPVRAEMAAPPALLRANAQKPKTFRVPTFPAQNFSG